MVTWVVINRQHLPRAARGPSQPRKSRPIRALPLAARLFNNPTFKPANDPQFPPASIPILELTPPSSHRKSPPSFHALKWNPFCNPFVFIFMHVMGGYTSLCGNYKSWPQIVRGQPLSHNMLWSRRTKTEYPHRLVHPPRGFNRLSPTPNPLSPFFSNTCALFCNSLHFFVLTKNSTLLFSINCALFAKNTRGCGALLQPRASRRGRRHAE